MSSTYTAGKMKIKDLKNFGFILDAIELMPKKKRFRVNLKRIDRTLAAFITLSYAAVVYLIWRTYGE